MRITKRQLRHIIKEAILSEGEMINIISNPHHDVNDFNILANYALRDDMQGALKDLDLKYYIDKNEASYLVDDIKEWLRHVGTEESHLPAPDGWDLDKVYNFVARFENEAYNIFSQKEKGEHATLPNKIAREIIGSALTQRYVMPDEIKNIEFQVRSKGGQPSNINIENEYDVSNISLEDATREGLTLDDIIKVLRDAGAKERKKQKPLKHTTPYYD